MAKVRQDSGVSTVEDPGYRHLTLLWYRHLSSSLRGLSFL